MNNSIQSLSFYSKLLYVNKEKAPIHSIINWMQPELYKKQPEVGSLQPLENIKLTCKGE